MYEYWYGLYLKSTIERTKEIFLEAFKASEYILDQECAGINEDALRKFNSKSYYWEEFVDLFLIQLENGWVHIVGLENMIYFPVKSFSISTVISKLACDAFLCGYNGSYYWWYEYYEEGHIVDRYNSNPFDDFSNRYWVDEADPRSIYNRKIGNKNNYTFPDEVYEAFESNPKKLTPIIRKEISTGDIEKLYEKKRPDSAVLGMSKLLDLPLIGKLTSETLSMLIYKWIESGGEISKPPKILEPIIENKTLVLIFERPKEEFFDLHGYLE